MVASDFLFASSPSSSGDLPSDEQLQDLVLKLTPPGFPSLSRDNIQIPAELRGALTQLAQPSVSALSEAGILPILNQAVHTFEQIPKLVDEVGQLTVCLS